MRQEPPKPHRRSEPVTLRAYLALTRAADAVAPMILRRRARRGKEDPARLGERLGHPGAARPEGLLVWFHAASVGESLALLTLIGQVRAARPDVTSLVTTGTRTSADLLASRLPMGALHHYAPLDTAGAVARFLDHWRPDLAVWSESELWPRLIVSAAARGVPMLLINARLSPRSAARWRRAPRLARALLSRFDAILAQDATTAGALTGLGVDAERLGISGTLKQETAPLPCDDAELERLRARIAGRRVWLAASTHPGEEDFAARAHAELLGRWPDLLLIIAPRHPGRATEVSALLEGHGLTVARRGAQALPRPETQVYLADTLGEMGLWYRLAPVAFVGGSLVPVGGHNPYEPAALDAAIIAGPHVQNFAGAYADLDREDGVTRVTDANGLAQAVATLLEPDRAARQAARARDAILTPGGATGRTLAAILSRLPAPEPGP